jgi:hypothetical protein
VYIDNETPRRDVGKHGLERACVHAQHLAAAVTGLESHPAASGREFTVVVTEVIAVPARFDELAVGHEAQIDEGLVLA